MAQRISPEIQQRIAELSHGLYHGSVTSEEFIEQVGDVEDPRVAELVFMLQREPERGGMHGVSDGEYDQYRARIQELIAQLSTHW